MTGKPSETGVYDTADTAYQYLLARKDIDPRQIIPFGLSLGGAAAIHLAATKPVGGLVTISAFTSMPDMARAMLPWLPTSLLLRYRFDNEQKMAAFKCPVFLAHGTADNLVPFSMNARLAKAAKGPVTLFPVEGAGHNDVLLVGGRDLTAKLGLFIERVRGSGQE